jgi:hypothetical protein
LMRHVEHKAVRVATRWKRKRVPPTVSEGTEDEPSEQPPY